MTQYTIDENTYYYLKELKQYNEEVGTLYDAPPSPLYGNICNVNDENEPVQGIFNVGSGSQKGF